MGRLPALALGAPLLAGLAGWGHIGCNDSGKSGAPRARREAVVASAQPARPIPSAQVSAKPTKARTLCTGAALDRELPGQALGHGEAPGAVGQGRWTWITLWAAWCAPCKEEMPRLLQWEKRLSGKLSIRFVSLDDDERQFRRFLQSQPKDGVRASYWLPEGKTRNAWLNDLKLDEDPELPVQILVNPRGLVHCIIEGAVEDGDFPRVALIVDGR
jgi:thiol-disulfide isomerase/thioredoxin